MDNNQNFRPLRRTKNAIPIDEAKALLKNERRGIFAVNGENGYPYAIPVNYYYDEAENKIYFHGAKSGLKVDCLKQCDKVCFTVFGNEHYEEHWAPYLQSAVVYGRCRLLCDDAPEIIENVGLDKEANSAADLKVNDNFPVNYISPDEKADRVRTLAIKYYPTVEDVERGITKNIKDAMLYEITIEHICGKQIHEK